MVHKFISFILFLLKFPKVFFNSNFYKAFYKKEGIEIGGPSKIFKKRLPVYTILKKLDGLNFKESNLWDQRNQIYEFNKTYIGEQTNLNFFKDNLYDFLLSSHTLEHSTNPIKAILEFKRIIKNDGYILLLVPKKDNNFDHKRQITKFDKLLENYELNMKEDDLSSLEEILEFHDLERNPESKSFEDFKKLSLNNFENRGLHHHVYDQNLLLELYNFVGISLIFTETTKHEYINLLKKTY